jgi:hypothetical protein
VNLLQCGKWKASARITETTVKVENEATAAHELRAEGLVVRTCTGPGTVLIYCCSAV